MTAQQFEFESLSLASDFSDRLCFQVQLVFGKISTTNALWKIPCERSDHWGFAVQANGCHSLQELRDSLHRSIAQANLNVWVTEATDDRFYLIGDTYRLLRAVENKRFHHPFFEANTASEIREMIDDLERALRSSDGLPTRRK